ncbi:MAG: hypothetical protein Kow0075_13830 [Salibacteraceae bacterium]
MGTANRDHKLALYVTNLPAGNIQVVTETIGQLSQGVRLYVKLNGKWVSVSSNDTFLMVNAQPLSDTAAIAEIAFSSPGVVKHVKPACSNMTNGEFKYIDMGNDSIQIEINDHTGNPIILTGTDSIWVRGLSAAVYDLYIANLDHTRDTVSVDLTPPDFPLPKLKIAAPLCANDPRSMAWLEFEEPTAYQSITWSTGDTLPSVLSPPAGPLTAVVTDSAGCTHEVFDTVRILSGTIAQIEGPSRVEAFSEAEFYNVGNAVEAYWTVGEDTYNGMSVNLQFDGSHAEKHIVVSATDGYCTEGDTMRVVIERSTVGYNEALTKEHFISVAGHGRILINGAARSRYTVIVYDLLGNAISHRNDWPAGSALDLSHMAQGIYVVSISDGNGKSLAEKKIFVQ